MTRRWRILLIALITLCLAAAAVTWYRAVQKTARKTPVVVLETIEHSTLPGGSALTQVLPKNPSLARIALAVTADALLSDTQLQKLSRDTAAQIVQVVLPQADCSAQQQVFNQALEKLPGAPTVVAGIGAGGTLAWHWLATQNNDKAEAISVGFNLQHNCDIPLPKRAAHGHWMVSWRDSPDEKLAAFVHDQPNANSRLSNSTTDLTKMLCRELRLKLIGEKAVSNGLGHSIVELPAAQRSDTVTLFLSGDGGWRDLDKEMAGHMAAMGYPVIGIDVLHYYWEHKAPEETADDLAELMHNYQQKWGTKRFILAGYSFGADVIPAVYNRLDPDDQNRIDGIILLAFARSGNFEINVSGWLGAEGKEAITGPEMAKLPASKVLCVYGVKEKKKSGCTENTAVGEILSLPGSHHFDRDYESLAKRLVTAIDKRQGRIAAQ